MLQAKGLEVAVFGASQVFEMTLARYSAGPGKAGIASACPGRPAPLGRAPRRPRSTTSSSSSCTGAWTTRRAPTRCPSQTARGPRGRRAPTSSWAGTRTGSTARAGWAASYVAYGLGNFVWWRSREPDSRSGVLTPVDRRRGRPRHPADGAQRRARGGLDAHAHRRGRHTARARRRRTAPGCSGSGSRPARCAGLAPRRT